MWFVGVYMVITIYYEEEIFDVQENMKPQYLMLAKDSFFNKHIVDIFCVYLLNNFINFNNPNSEMTSYIF